MKAAIVREHKTRENITLLDVLIDGFEENEMTGFAAVAAALAARARERIVTW